MSTIKQKADHVRAAEQTREHSCHWPGCDEQVPPAKWGCRTHWFMLPYEIRTAIWNAYQIGQEHSGGALVSPAYIKAARWAQRWIKENYQSTPRFKSL